MFRKGKGSVVRFVINAAVFLLLEIAALVMLNNSGQIQRIWISKGVHVFLAKVWGVSENIRHYFSLKKENEELSGIIFRQEQELRLYRELSQREFNKDSVFEIVGSYRYIPASIAKITQNLQHNYIIIDKGSEDGISSNSGIITEKGVLGILDAVGRHYSYGRSFKNSDMMVSARIGQTGPIGALSWDGLHSNGAILKEVPQHIVLHEGDTVYTTGFSSLFPADIPLGTTGKYTVVNGATYDIEVRLFEDFSSIRYVTVVNNIDTKEITELERLMD